jgi:hypothetical protein
VVLGLRVLSVRFLFVEGNKLALRNIRFHKFGMIVSVAILFWVCVLAAYTPIQSSVRAQQPTGSIPTVTGTPSGVIVAVYLDLVQIKVYSGPSTYLYPAVGVLLAGQEAPARGISEDGNWIQIYYPGVPGSVAWVYAPYVSIKKNGNLAELSSPATPTPASTPTINPTLQAAFIPQAFPTRLPTFTPPAPLVISTFSETDSDTGNIPAGLLIFGFGFLGALGVLISFLQGR